MSVSFNSTFGGPFRARIMHAVGRRRVLIQITGKSRAGFTRGELLEVDRNTVYDRHHFAGHHTVYTGRAWELQFPPE